MRVIAAQALCSGQLAPEAAQTRQHLICARQTTDSDLAVVLHQIDLIEEAVRERIGILAHVVLASGDANSEESRANDDQIRDLNELLGSLHNRVTHSSTAAPWTFGVSALMRNLAARGLLAR